MSDGPVRPPLPLAPEGTGRWAIRAAGAGAGVQMAATAAALLAMPGRGVHGVVCTGLFVGGLVAMAVAFVRAVRRSRAEVVDVAGLFLLLGSAPRRTRWSLWAAVAAQAVVGIAGAAARPYTSLAFGVLAPLWAYGFTILWNASYGAFPPRPARA